MANGEQRDDGTQNGPGEQIRPQGHHENEELDNLRGGADPSGGKSAEVPRDNSKAGPAIGPGQDGGKDASPLSTPSDGRPTEDDLAKDGTKGAPAEGGDK